MALKNEEFSVGDLRKVADGIYRGEAGTIAISVTVDVFVTDHLITRIDLLEHKNGQGDEAEFIIEDILLKQSLEVDTISSATYSSLMILKAVDAALR